jgi:hypothetical protein
LLHPDFAIGLGDVLGMNRGTLVCLSIFAALLACGKPAAAADPCAQGKLEPVRVAGGDKLLLRWTGTVDEAMATAIADAFDTYKRRTTSVELRLNSCGGRTDYMAATIGVLGHIKLSHQLTTVVDRGATCASACIPIFLASDRRRAALSSLWLFHRTWQYQQTGSIDGVETRAPGSSSLKAYLDRYFADAGVSRTWLRRLKGIIETTASYWQTGRDLWESKSGVITETIGDIEPFDSGRTYLAPVPGCSAMCRG